MSFKPFRKIPIFLLLLLSTQLRAQLSTSSQVNGTVTDSTGALVTGATVTAVDTATQAKSTALSNQDGTFVLSGLPPGIYIVTITKEGFETYQESQVELHPATPLSIAAKLQVGQATTQVSVVASAAQVETTSSAVSSQVSGEQTSQLPLNGRNYQTLSALMPGVVNQSAGTALGTGGYTTSNVMVVGGLPTSTTFYALDGVWNENTGSMGQTAITPNPDTIQEVRVLQNNYEAKYSLLGNSVVLIQTKSGTTAYHGLLFEYLRNNDLNTRNYFSPNVPILRQNIYGYTLGGPVPIPFYHGKKKTFFFASTQWVSLTNGSVILGATPTAAQRAGTFTSSIKNPATGLPFPQSSPGVYQIPAALLNPNTLAFINALYPLPNDSANGFNNYLNTTPNTLTQRDDEFKVEHNFNDKYRLTAEFFDEDQDSLLSSEPDSGSPFPTNRRNDVTSNQDAQVQFNAVISPTMVNTATIAMNRTTYQHNLIGTWEVDQVPGYSQTLPFNGVLSNRLPLVTLSQGYSPQGIAASVPRHADDLDDTITDAWSWLRGKHYISAGFTQIFNTKRQIPTTASNGQWTFTGTATGNALADFLLGDGATFTQISTTPEANIHAAGISPYVEDQFQVRPHLSFTAGLRISFMPLPHTPVGFEANFNPLLYQRSEAPIVNNNGTLTLTPNYNPSNGLVINGVNGVPNNFSTNHQWYYAPQFGFAWDVLGDGKTSLRGGYGITYTRIFTGQDCSYNCATNPPIINSVNLVNPAFPSPGNSGRVKFSAQTISAADFNIQATQAQSYSLSLQHQFPGNWIVTAAGAGNQARHLPETFNINQPLLDAPYDFNPIINTGTVLSSIYGPYYGYGPINQLNTIVNSNWTALELSARHPAGRNLFISLAYTWSHGLSNQTTINYYNPNEYYGNTSLNVPQVFTASLIYSLPWLLNDSGWKGTVLGGWQLSDITTIDDGYSLTPGLSIPEQGNAARPNITGATLGGPKNVAEWFNTGAFTAPAAGYFGNAGTGIIRGPGLINFDMTLQKTFKIYESVGLEFRAEAFNVFNHTNFTTVSTNYGSGSYGRVTAAADPRIMEFALRLHF
jgi:Carboxypeptidase regulatory-like domain